MAPPEDNGERIARLEANSEHIREKADRAHARIDMMAQDILSTASSAGRESATSYMEGLNESFIKDTQKRIKRIEWGLIAVIAALGGFGIRIFGTGWIP